MLVLSRHRNEEIVIGHGTPHETRIMIVDIRGDKVRVGINAPRGLEVHRAEVQEAINRDGRRGNVPELDS